MHISSLSIECKRHVYRIKTNILEISVHITMITPLYYNGN
jgi:hypothetical protein